MEILLKVNGNKGKFYVNQNSKTLAEMTFVWAGDDKIIIDHTEVQEALAGQQVGKQMVQKAVEMARTKHIKIIPLCPFAKSVFDKIAAYEDVLYKPVK